MSSKEEKMLSGRRNAGTQRDKIKSFLYTSSSAVVAANVGAWGAVFLANQPSYVVRARVNTRKVAVAGKTCNKASNIYKATEDDTVHVLSNHFSHVCGEGPLFICYQLGRRKLCTEFHA